MGYLEDIKKNFIVIAAWKMAETGKIAFLETPGEKFLETCRFPLRSNTSIPKGYTIIQRPPLDTKYCSLPIYGYDDYKKEEVENG
jgi:hypothetical protein